MHMEVSFTETSNTAKCFMLRFLSNACGCFTQTTFILSRNTIAKYLNAGTIEPTFTVPERPSKLDPFADKLTAWLKTEAGKSRKQRRTLKQVHADLVALGFTGSYGRVAAFARKSARWRATQSAPLLSSKR